MQITAKKPALSLNTRTGFYITIFISTLLLLIPAFFNGYPLVNPDDNTYLCSGFLPDTPFDRPITYGLVLRLISLNGISLFIAAFIQCWLVSWLLVKNIQRIVLINNVVAAIAVTFFLALFTSLSWISSEMIPDVCTSISLLCLSLILLQQENRANTILLYIIYTIAIATHMSHVMIFFLLLAIVWLLRKKLFDEAMRKNAVKRIYLAAFLTVATIAIMGSAISKSKHVFAVGALLEQGILKTYLDDQCDIKKYRICAYKDHLPQDANVFLWSPESPLYQTGGWEANKDEYNEIVAATYTQPKYLFLRIKMSALFTIKQCATFNTGDGNFSIDVPLYNTIQKYLPADTVRFRKSAQHESTLLPAARVPNVIQYIVVCISCIVLLALLFVRKNRSTAFRLFVFLSIATIAVNMWDCATFAQVNGRYGCRVIWLLPLCAVMGIINWYKTGTQTKKAY